MDFHSLVDSGSIACGRNKSEASMFTGPGESQVLRATIMARGSATGVAGARLSGVFSGLALRRHIFRTPVIVVGMYRALGMIGCVLRSVNGGRFNSLVGVGQFFDAL